ncbi:maleylpyruvate isomerase family mycothiol-dependent enzyme [Pseudonocardia abyssalis]|uniref:Maleylpyruvate isomerase family mycothiol-dependent enzyme n=1 Tax=Pseudonocardia abyssalis TaxID=2792008 RepID=A0ABS6UW37_9PSEU|nr:maleylpyruvate isomerase family mycothiol-dependent enzyme [Pseudonocardia abyssalis]MBW0117643.1 maleylpyruvate isomerase family mycothiol-dependent enzyme [Pseudonocardia abyssalis]MBW0136489.1 maleylpyruvate isomerase family mycothiol-dependent enzyme [Pseudonocardia abyssalis]
MQSSRETVWSLVHDERAALAADLADLAPEQWAVPSLCGRWSVEEVVAHLTAAASLGPFRWIRSMAGARFDAELHNARRLAEHRGATPAETLARFRAVVPSTTAASGHTPAWLGEVVVHAGDLRRPLRLPHSPSVEAATEVARFFASRDFTVNSRTAIAGLRLEAVDGEFATGEGPLVRGTTVALVMAMSGRAAFCDDLEGPGVETLRGRA